MARFTDTEKSIRKMIMDQVLAHGTSPSTHEIAAEHGLAKDEVAASLKNLEAGVCIAVSNETHAGMKTFQGEKLKKPLPPLGEVFYARPFACFENHYKIYVNGVQKWHAECSVEACGIGPMFPGREVVVESHCRLTKEPVRIIAKGDKLLDYSPKTMRVHFGFALEYLADDAIGWCDFNSFFASEEAAIEWRKKHPHVKGTTKSVEAVNKFIVELVGKGRLDYDYQLTMPIGRLLIQPGRFGLAKPGPLGIPVFDPFFIPSPHFFQTAKKKGYGHYIRNSLL